MKRCMPLEKRNLPLPSSISSLKRALNKSAMGLLSDDTFLFPLLDCASGIALDVEEEPEAALANDVAVGLCCGLPLGLGVE